MEPTFFVSPAEFREWLERHHEEESELVVGFHKKASGGQSMSWAESVDEALCFGWIDGVRRSAGAEAYTIRFTPRRPRSIWSNRNVARVEALEAEGRMRPAGRNAFAASSEERTGVYSAEREREAQLEPEQEKLLRANAKAWEFFQGQAPSYRRTAIHWVVSAKRAETRERRLAALIEDSAAGHRVKPLRR